MNIHIEYNHAKYLGELVRYTSNAKKSGLWKRISSHLKTVVNMLFDQQGGDYGRAKWPAIDPSMYGKRRYGSDGTAQGTYAPGTKPLQASGKYKKSFKLIEQTPVFMQWGSDHPKADRIPYGGWQEAGNKRRARYVPRYALPDGNHPLINDEIAGITRQWLDDGVKQAILAGGR